MSDPDHGTAADTRPPFTLDGPPFRKFAADNLHEAIDRWFTFHAMTPEQVEQSIRIREAGKALALAIAENSPPGGDQTAAIRKVREATMTAITGIACER